MAGFDFGFPSAEAIFVGMVGLLATVFFVSLWILNTSHDAEKDGFEHIRLTGDPTCVTWQVTTDVLGYEIRRECIEARNDR